MANPTSIFDKADPGDEVLRRFRFQVEFVAIECISLLRPDAIADCIYCEQIEDSLIELKDGRFIAKAIKTRELDQIPLKATDDAIEAALAKFCKDDDAYPGHFASFQLVTNFTFYTGDGGACIRNLIECGKGEPKFDTLSRRSEIRKQITRIASIANVSVDQALSTLAKLELEETRTGVDLAAQITTALSECADFRQLPYVQLLAAGRLLVERIWACSSKAFQKLTEAHSTTLDIQGRAKALAVADKRVDHQTVLECVRQAASAVQTPEQELLVIRDYLPRDGTPAVFGIMQAKMAAGGMTAMNVEQFKDDVLSMDATFLRWKERYDLGEANRRLQHIQQLALQQCRRVHNDSVAPTGFQAPIVTDVEALRDNLGDVVEKEGKGIFGCRKEHLSGAVGMITEECRVWWSAPFIVVPQS